MKEPKVTFVIPCLNSSDTIGDCVGHIMDLDYPMALKQVIVVDNGSKDQTVQISKERGAEVVSDPEASIAGLRNLGAQTGDGELLVFVDSDCLLRPNWLRVALKHLGDDSVGLTGSKTYDLADGATWVEKAWKVHLDYSGEGSNPGWLTTRAIAVRRDVFDKIGGFDQEKTTCEDVDLGYSIGKTHKIVVDKELSPIHLKNPTTLKELYGKEKWRGKDSLLTSLEYFTSGRWRLNELISLALPFYYSFFFVVLIVGLLLSLVGKLLGLKMVISCLFLMMIPVALLALRTVKARGENDQFRSLFLVYSVYIAARTRAVFSLR